MHEYIHAHKDKKQEKLDREDKAIQALAELDS